MTFDEALKELDDDTRVTDEDNIEYTVGLDFGEVESVIEELRVTYAPTIEMTPKEYEIFKSAKVDEDSADWLDDISWGKVDYNYPKFMQAWLHPECVKVVDDERN